MRRLFFQWSVLLLLSAGPLAAGDNRWTPIGPNIPGALIREIEADPHDSGRLIASVEVGPIVVPKSLGLYRTDDGGGTWTEINQGLETGASIPTVFSLAADPDAEGVFYAGTSAGLFKTVDGGDSWQKASQGLTITSVLDVELLPGDTDTIFAAGVRYEPCNVPF